MFCKVLKCYNKGKSCRSYEHFRNEDFSIYHIFNKKLDLESIGLSLDLIIEGLRGLRR